MDMFMRVAQLRGDPRDIQAWVEQVTDAYRAATGTDVAAWASLVGGTAGRWTWTQTVDGAAEVAANGAAAVADDAYVSSLEQGRHLLVGVAHDLLLESVGAVEPQEPEPGAATEVTTAVAAPGHIGAAISWGLEINEHVAMVTGLPASMFLNGYGRFSTLTWMAPAPDLAALDTARRRLRDDDGYNKLLARGGSLFVGGSGRRQLVVRRA